MDTIEIYDSNQKLKFANEDLRAVQSLILMATDHAEYDNAHEVLKVIDRALGLIICDIQESIDAISEISLPFTLKRVSVRLTLTILFFGTISLCFNATTSPTRIPLINMSSIALLRTSGFSDM